MDVWFAERERERERDGLSDVACTQKVPRWSLGCCWLSAVPDKKQVTVAEDNSHDLEKISD